MNGVDPILENSPEGPIEALHAAGTGKSALLVYGFLPQVFGHLVSYSLYRWECAIRSAAILGLVGAGGLGQRDQHHPDHRVPVGDGCRSSQHDDSQSPVKHLIAGRVQQDDSMP